MVRFCVDSTGAKSRLTIDFAMSRRQATLKQRRLVLGGLTLACVMAHAAVLVGWHTAHSSGDSQSSLQIQAVALQTRTLQESAAVPPIPFHQPASRVPPIQRTVPRAAAPHELETTGNSAKEATDAPVVTETATAEHLPTRVLDMPPMPRSAPDEQFVDDTHKSGLPIRVRVFVEDDGKVSSVDLLNAAPGDEGSAERVMAMFRETAFSPGRRQGRDVPSFIDIEIVLEPTLPQLVPVLKQ
jgi:hypothetical protein